MHVRLAMMLGSAESLLVGAALVVEVFGCLFVQVAHRRVLVLDGEER